MARKPLNTGVAFLIGIVAAVLGAGVAEFLAAWFAPTGSPIIAVGGTLIDAAPLWAKETAIAWFGTNDKLALIVLIIAVVAIIAGVAGILQSRTPPWGAVVAAALTVVGAVMALTRPNATVVTAIPMVVGGGVAVVTLILLTRAGRAAATSDSSGPDRRAFLVWGGAATIVGVLTLMASSALRAGTQVATTVRNLVLPKPAVPAPPVPATAELGIPGLAPVITPNDDFYRIDTTLGVPQVDASQWKLHVHGMVDHEIVMSFDELLALPMEEHPVTLACVSNNVGGPYIGNAMWLGYPIRELLARAVPHADADMVLSTSVDGWTAGTPLDVLTDDRPSLLAIGMNGKPLPPEHGFPVRMVVPGLYGYVSATKWVVKLEVTRFDKAQGYWTPRGWSALGPIKLQSRIDVPRRGNPIPAGDSVIAGVAWQQHVGISGVEVQVDDGAWTPATLATAISDDSWVQWSMPWTATAGEHIIRCRATNARGEVQTEEKVPSAPNGATGWHTISIQVA